MSARWILLKNAIANLGRGGAAGLVALILPPILVRHMTAADYAIWALVLQVGSYVGYLDFGLQTAVGRYVAFAHEKGDSDQRDTIFSTAFAALLGAGVLSILVLVVFVAALGLIFPGIPAESVATMRWAMAILGTALACGLPASAWNGVFIGLQRYEVPAVIIGGARLLSAAGLVAAAFAGSSVVVMAAIMAGVYLASYVVQYVALRRGVPDLEFDRTKVSRATARELYSYCIGMTVLSLSALLVTGFDLILVGRFDFMAVTPYSVAASIVTFIAGGLGAVLNVMMPHAAALHARENPEALGRLVLNSTRIAVVLLVLTGIPLLVFAGPILKVWIGPQFVASGQPILAILLIANIIRLVGLPYAIVLISAGQQHLVKVTPLTEGTINLVSSVILGSIMGAMGVAVGTLAGSVCGVASHLLYSMPRTHRAIPFSRKQFLLSGVAAPMLSCLPLLILAFMALTGYENVASRPLIFAAGFLVSGAASAVLLNQHGLLHKPSPKTETA